MPGRDQAQRQAGQAVPESAGHFTSWTAERLLNEVYGYYRVREDVVSR